MYKRLDEEYYVENPLLKQLKDLGYSIYRQNKDYPEDAKEVISFKQDYEPIYGASKKFRSSFREVILEEELKKAIKRINPWIEEDQINEVVGRINKVSGSLIEANREIHDLLLENISVAENRKTKEKSPTVKFIDFNDISNNSFIAISQFKVNIFGTEKHIIPDIVLFINGLPLVVIECKSPTVADPISEAIEQLLRYQNRRGGREGNEKLFYYNLLTIATSNQKAKYGTITSDYEHFVEWKDPYPYSINDINAEGNVTSQQILVQGMLDKNNLLDILHNFTLFKEDNGKIIKIVPRYQQYRAVKKIIKNLKENKLPKDKGGIIWHTQGSGKSLTMMFTVRSMYHDKQLAGYKIVFITDRKDLEEQLNETSRSIGFTVHKADSIKKLQELLRTNTPDLVMGMIHKFQERELEKEFPLLNESSNILVMIDEAHRTQYKLLGANLRKALPNAVRIAFTGTPIEKTELTFGDYIDKYSIRQAVEDQVTVDIVYEGRTHTAEVSDEEAINAKFEDVFADADATEQRKIMGRYTWKAYLEAEEVIRDKAEDMIDHYIKHVFPNRFKAQVVAVSRLAAIRYKHALEEALKRKVKELNNKEDIDLLKRLKVEVVISSDPNDPPEFKQFTDPNRHEEIIRSFKRPFEDDGGDVGIIVVNKMLITGFDAPIEQVMYLDDVIKEHNLLQAIARVNRVYKNKSCGFVVDYVGVLKHLKEALAIYADEDIEEISQVVKNKAKSIDELKFTHSFIIDFFNKYKIEDWRNNIDGCIDLLVDEEVRNEFITLTRRFNKAIDAVLPDPEALKYVKDLKILSFIREAARNRYRDDTLSIKDASKKIREIVEEYLITKGVDPKIEPTPLFSDEFMEKVKRQSSKAKAKELEYAIREYIVKHHEEDPEFYERFAEVLKKVLEEYKDNWEELAKELEVIRERMKKGREAEETYGFDPKKEMPFFGLIKQYVFGNKELKKEDIDLLVNITKDVIEIIKRDIKKVGFWDNEVKKKKLRSHIASRLLETKDKILMSKKNELAQRLLELAYHIYGEQDG